LWQRTQIKIIGVKSIGGFRGGPRDLRASQTWFDSADDTFGDAVLEIENIGQIAVEAIGPDVTAGRGFDQLTSDAHPPASAPHAALQHVANAKLAPDPAHVHRAALIGEGGVARDHEQPAGA
jgi:hypothetical protein